MLIEGNATSPDGFQAGAFHCGIRPDRDDLALLASDVPASAAGVFTTNKVQAPPVKLCRETVARGTARAILVNSGNANACTGEQGMKDAREMVALAASHLQLEAADILVASTGLIGQPLPMDRLRTGIPQLQLSRDGERAARAIMTTDAFLKTTAARVGPYTIGGMAKGAGMIHPNMATTLAFFTTDAPVAPADLQKALRTAIDASFNSISVDGDTSTNDCALILANGVKGGTLDLPAFTAALTEVAQHLAKLVVRDGEGATRLVEIRVQGAHSDAEARQAAQTVAGSLLVKTMLFGGEPNWGRVLAALGRAGVEMQEERVDLWFDDTQVVRQGLGTGLAAPDQLQKEEILLNIHLGMGGGRSQLWTCDLGHNYVELNGSYIS